MAALTDPTGSRGVVGSKDSEPEGALTSTAADVEGLQRGDGMTNASIALRRG